MSGFYYRENTQESNKDYETKQVRDIDELELTDKQINNLEVLTYKAGFKKSSHLIESLIGDLTKCHDNGSDERELAENWYQRAFGSYINTMYTFREFLHEYDIYQDELVESEDYFNKNFNLYLSTEIDKEHDSKDECISIAKELQAKEEQREKLIDEYVDKFKADIKFYSAKHKKNGAYTEDTKSFMLEQTSMQFINLALKDVRLDNDGKSSVISNINREVHKFLNNDSFE